MSHFSVAVIHNEDENIDELLAPFQENNMENCPKEYLGFEVEVLKKDFKKHAKILIKNIENDISDALKRKDDKEYERNHKIYLNHSEHYKNGKYESIFERYYGGEKNKKTGDWGYWSNPNSKWDWYQVGGRWAGMLKLKKGAVGGIGKKSWGMKKIDPYKGGRVDSAMIGDIDFKVMAEEKKEDAEKRWRKRKYFISKLKKAGKKDKEINQQIAWEYEGTVNTKKKDWIKNKISFSTYSILANGEWKESGEMGWFGMSRATNKEEEKWQDSYMAKLHELSDSNLYITIVDIHI